MANNIGRLHSPHDEKLEDFQILENSADVAYHGTHVEVQCLPLATYIAALNVKKVDYLSLDIEGLEPEVLQTIPFDIVDIRVRVQRLIVLLQFLPNLKLIFFLSDTLRRVQPQ